MVDMDDLLRKLFIFRGFFTPSKEKTKFPKPIPKPDPKDNPRFNMTKKKEFMFS